MTSGGLRQLIHASTASIGLLGMVSPGALRLATAYLAVTAVIVEALRLRVPQVQAALSRLVPVFRASEGHRPSGAMWLMVGFALAALLPAPGGMTGVLVAALADPAGAFVGGRLGSGTGKTLAGTAAVGAVGGAVALMLGFGVLGAAAVGLTAAVVERWSGPLNDNLTLAPAVALVVRAFA